MLKKILIHTGAFAAAIAVMWGALILTSLIPNEKIYDNMLKSAESYRGPGPITFMNGKKVNAVADNYADVVLLNILWNIDSREPVKSSIDTKYYDGEEYGENWGFYAAVNGTPPNTDYTRYWHGSVIFIRPLMLFTDVKGVKTIGFWTVIVLALAVCVILAARRQYFAAAAFALSMICVQIYNVRFSLEYIPMFIVFLAMCIPFICLEKRGNSILTVLSAVSGAATAFFDFLTVETLSILLPLLLVMIIREQENRLGNLRDNLILTVNCSACWGVSYISTFILKWLLASAVTGENKFTSALTSVEVRFGGLVNDMSFIKQLFLAPAGNISTLFGGESHVDGKKIAVGLVLTILIFGGIYFIFRRKTANKVIAVLCLIIGLVPYLRFMILNNHSYLHEIFTYRAQAATVLALFTAVWFNTRLSQINISAKTIKQ